MGFLKYINHDEQRERPVHFHWQILDFDGTRDYESLLGLRLEPVSSPTDTTVSQTNTARQALVFTPAPRSPLGVKGVPVETSDFRRSPIDYEERDKNNRKLGKVGEDLVNIYEKSALLEIGRQDLADRVELVCRTVGDQAGFDVRSFDRGTFEETHIEVKNTSGPAATPFFMSAAEVEYSRNCACRYVIYRLYEYKADSGEVKFFKIENGKDTLEFTPATFRVRKKL